MASTFAMPRHGCVSVRCSAQDGDDKKEQSTKIPPTTPVVTPPRPRPPYPTPPPTPPPNPYPTPPPTPPPANKQQRTTPIAPKVSTKFSEVLALSGPAPERIDGRLAMIEFVAAMAVEVSNGQDVFAQISNGRIPWFLGTSVVLSLASLVPLFEGVSVESNSKGLMTLICA
ncbi:hypothetical protein Ddye_022294 [Dipteronia dyeriana]|uniref:Uncharacterized protein n=1 Tax=Dipteronia dyeriana TaxID=168575 RepID=A0AAD9WX44_9ROSI|nr:hypothetical protein Ddye_022294 [Dipteronia dyeriana]